MSARNILVMTPERKERRKKIAGDISDLLAGEQMEDALFALCSLAVMAAQQMRLSKFDAQELLVLLWDPVVGAIDAIDATGGTGGTGGLNP